MLARMTEIVFLFPIMTGEDKVTANEEAEEEASYNSIRFFW